MFRLCVICITLLITACNPSHTKTKDILPSPKHFSYFEISYNSGWGYSFSFATDSNSIFFFPRYQLPYTDFKFKYGRLPDSIFNNIDTIASLLTTMTNMDKSKVYCYDCGQVSILSMLGKDTLRLYQEGTIDERVNKLITQLDILNRNDTASKSIPFFDWKTAQDVITLPPKVVK